MFYLYFFKVKSKQNSVDYIRMPRAKANSHQHFVFKNKLNFLALRCVSVCCSGRGDNMGLSGRVREEGQHDIVDVLGECAFFAAIQRLCVMVNSFSGFELREIGRVQFSFIV